MFLQAHKDLKLDMTVLEAKHVKLSRSFADLEGQVQKVRPGAFCLLQLLCDPDGFVACCNRLLTVLAGHMKHVTSSRVSASCVPSSKCLTLPGRVSFAFQFGFRLAYECTVQDERLT